MQSMMRGLLMCAVILFMHGNGWSLEMPWEKEAVTKDAVKDSPEAPAKTGTLHALVIGVGVFQNPKITPLSYAASDARSVHDYLSGLQGMQESRPNLILLVDDAATASGVRQAFDSIVQKVRPRDHVLVYVSTHTFPRTAQLILHDTDISSAPARESSSLTSEMLKSFVAKIGEAGLAILIDAGYRRETAVDILGGSQAAFAEGDVPGYPGSMQKTAKVMVFSTGSAWESDVLRSSYFTFYYLQGLRQNRNSLRDAFHYARPLVAEKVRQEKNARQTIELITTQRDWNMSLTQK